MSLHFHIIAHSEFSSADVLVIVNAIHCIIFGALGMAVEAKIQFIVSGVTFMNSRLGKGSVFSVEHSYFQVQTVHSYRCRKASLTIIANIWYYSLLLSLPQAPFTFLWARFRLSKIGGA